MRMSPILLFHICTGTIGMLSGFVAVFLRKGSRQHGIAGNVFAVSMLGLSASGAFLAILKFQPGNILGGVLTFYMVSTAWLTARHSDGRTRIFDCGALLFVLAVAAVEVTLGFQAWASPTGMKYDYPPAPYFIFGSVALIAALGDVRMLLRGGISGAHRVARHLWRMCFALFVAAVSIFLARAQIFPVILQKMGALVFLSFLPLLLMIYWLVRVLFTKHGMSTNNARGHASTIGAVDRPEGRSGLRLA
jgi:uncharacterized membrane protein